jgi:purine nucleoside phosphorylase
MEKVNIGIIGGSGLYQMPELENVREIEVETPLVSRRMHLLSVSLMALPLHFYRDMREATSSRLPKFRIARTSMV